MEKLTAKVKKIIVENSDTKTIFFSAPKLSYEAGQYITVFFKDSSTPEGKAYSLSSAPHEKLASITVKNIGEYSGRLCSLNVGETFSISMAYGFFNPNTKQPLVCLSAGCGLAPIFSIVKDELKKDDQRKISLFFSNKTTGDIPHKNQLDKLSLSYRHLNINHYITREKEVKPPHKSGRINIDACLEIAEENTKFLVCGSVDFVRSMWQELILKGILKQNISTETFFE